MAKKYDIPTIEKLLDAGVHFGHQVKRWHPDMEQYIYTAKRKIHIVDLEKTEALLKEAADAVYDIAKKGGKIIFVGTKKQARDIIEIEGKRSGAMYVTERWLGGTITNIEVIKKNNIDKLLDLKRKKEEGDLKMYTKKERLLIDREIERLERFVGGLTSLKKVPAAVFVVDSRRERTAVSEAKRAKLPVFALIDTNSNPKNIDYPIPGNDDAIKSIALVVKTLSDAIEAGYKDYAAGVKEEEAKAEKEKKAEEKKAAKEAAEEKKEKAAEAKKTAKEEKKEAKADVKKPTKKETKAKPKATKKAPAKKTTKAATKKEEPKKKRGRPKKSDSDKK